MRHPHIAIYEDNIAAMNAARAVLTVGVHDDTYDRVFYKARGRLDDR